MKSEAKLFERGYALYHRAQDHEDLLKAIKMIEAANELEDPQARSFCQYKELQLSDRPFRTDENQHVFTIAEHYFYVHKQAETAVHFYHLGALQGHAECQYNFSLANFAVREFDYFKAFIWANLSQSSGAYNANTHFKEISSQLDQQQLERAKLYIDQGYYIDENQTRVGNQVEQAQYFLRAIEFLQSGDMENANRFLSLASSSDFLAALLEQGLGYIGEGFFAKVYERSLERATILFQKAHALGSAQGSFELSKVYSMQKRSKDANAYLLEAASRGSGSAAFALGVFSKELNPNISKKWFELALGRGIQDAKKYLE